MVKIRLKRVGKAKQPSYRVVVADSRSPRDGRIIESIGHYNPRVDPSVVEIDTDRAVHWLERGAQPSDSVRKLLQITGAWSAFTGEAPPEPKRPTAAASVTATPAASTEEEPAEPGEAPAETTAETEEA
jgi:small subunit ribosomal protein S16